jgi:acid phosphatase type 7
LRLAASLRARHPYGPRLLSARPLGGRSRHAHRQTHPRRRLGAVAIAAFPALGLAAYAGDTDPATNITATTATPLENGKAYYFRLRPGRERQLGGVCRDTQLTTYAAGDRVIAAAGDIACDPADPFCDGGAGRFPDKCQQRATSDLLVKPGAGRRVAAAGQPYSSASLSKIQTVYHPAWGRVKSISHPVLGNHESSGRGNFDCFNGSGVFSGPAGTRGKGWYSYNLGDWHLIALHSNCTRPADTSDVVDCGVGSELERWLRTDLSLNQSRCSLTCWHHPRWSSGHDKNNDFTQPFWQALYDARAEVVPVAHSHDYERFAPMDAGGNLNRSTGIREFVVGTGDAFFTGSSSRVTGSEIFDDQNFGVLKLALGSESYSWRFESQAGRSFTDSGTASCQ